MLTAAIVIVILLVSVVVVVHDIPMTTSSGVDEAQADAAFPVGVRPSEALGRLILSRIIDEKWVHRTVESIRFVGGSRSRRQVSLDLEVPSNTAPTEHVEGIDRACCIIPLAYIPKGPTADHGTPLRGFDLRDHDGRCLPLLGRRANNLASLAALAVATQLLASGNTDKPLTEAELTFLWDIVALPEGRARARLGALEEKLARPDASIAQVRAASAAHPGFYPFLLKRFARYNLLMTDIGARQEAARTIVKLAYDIPVPRDDRLKSILAKSGWVGARINYYTECVPLPCAGLHLQIELPDQMEFTFAATRLVYHEQDPRGSRPGSRAQASVATALRDHPSLAHTQHTGVPALARLEASAVVRVERGGSAWIALVASVLLTAALFGGAAWPDRVSRQVEAAATILVLAPGLLAGAAVLSGEHKVVAGLRAGFHVLVTLLVLLAVVAASSLVVLVPSPSNDQDIELLGRVWACLRWVGVGVAVLMLPFAIPFSKRKPNV